ncbi:hypothetical protein B0H11DRAFT_2423573 [Mycena galericulata]|nr:hypothetical protein B0H11DRAFT_2423573 [Mycena galericulata]
MTRSNLPNLVESFKVKRIIRMLHEGMEYRFDPGIDPKHAGRLKENLNDKCSMPENGDRRELHPERNQNFTHFLEYLTFARFEFTDFARFDDRGLCAELDLRDCAFGRIRAIQERGAATTQLNSRLVHLPPVQSVDLEHGGKIAGRYLGAFGDVRSFSTSGADPNVFLIAGNDGYARLYDVRRPLPVLTLCSNTGEDSCGGALLIHPDGVPGIFTAASRDEVIRFWDVRGKRMVYELSTGNTQVTGMAWHEAHCALYVSTTCEYMDQYGRSRGYRHAKVPRTARTLDLEGEDSDEDYDSDDDDDDGPCWPKNAAHAEDYFGHLFDAGDHRIFRYAFKEGPDISVLPAYGEATVYSG